MKILPAILFGVFANLCHAQTNFEDFVKISEQEFNQEKIYLEFDKNNYSSGDDVWIKCFVFNGYQLSNLSKRVYIELLDINKKVIDKKVHALSFGTTDVTLSIPKNLPENILYVRAYTKLTANSEHEQKAIYPIKVFNESAQRFITKKTDTNYNAKVFVEGGNGFINKNSKYVVRISNHLNPDFEWKAAVYNSTTNTKLKEVEVYDSNVGSFYLKPDKDVFYTVKITSKDGPEKIIPLENIKEKGVAFEIGTNEGGIKYNFKSINTDESLKGYKIIATYNNKIIYSADVNSNTADVSKFLDKNIFSNYQGIVAFSLFDAHKNKIAERLIFLEDSLDKLASKNKINFKSTSQKRGENELILPIDENIYHIKVKNKEAENEENFYSALWLTKDFKSAILEPKKYFQNSADSRALDALLISEKWERFTTNSYAKPEELELVYKGRLNYYDKAFGNLNLNLLLQNDEKTLDVFQKRLNEKGEFLIDDLYFSGDLKVNYHVNSKNQKQLDSDKLKLEFQPLYSFITYEKELPKYNYVLTSVNEESRKEIVNKIKNEILEKELYNANIIKLKEVLIKKDLAKKTSDLNKKLSSGIYNNPISQRIYDLINNENVTLGYTSIHSFITSKIPGISYDFNDGDIIYKRGTLSYNVYLDESITYMNLDDIVNINDVAMIKILNNDGIVGNAIMIYTKRGDLFDYAEKDKIKELPKIKGYDIAKEYLTSDDYKDYYSSLPSDSREVLLWQTVYNSNNENNKIKYYSNDTPTKNVVEIIGSDKFGNITTFTQEVGK